MLRWCCVWLLGLAAGLASAANTPDAALPVRARLTLTDRTLPPLYIKSHVVQAQLQGRVARVTAESVYRNDTARDLEATYRFPLPDGATVERFVMWMDGQPVEAAVQEKQQARAIYESIVRRKRDPGLLEQTGAGEFCFRIFPVRANSDQKVRLKYTQVLPLEARSGTLRFVYPLALGEPRHPESRVAKDFVLSAALEMDGPIVKLDPGAHRVSARIDAANPRKATVSLEESASALDQGFQLAIHLAGAAAELSDVAFRDPRSAGADAHGALMLFLAPRSPQGEQPKGKNVALVMDISGSMQGEKFRQAQAALHAALDSLLPEDRFAVIAFSDAAQSFAREWTPASETGRREAHRFVDGLAAAGGTNIGCALAEALALQPQAGRPMQILFATDGEPTVGEIRPDLLVAQVANKLAQADGTPPRLFTFGIGYSVNAVLLDRIAAAGRGDRAYVREGERIDRKIAELCEKIATPLLTDVRIEFSPELGVEQAYPPRCADLYEGRQTVVTARYRRPGRGQVTVRGKRDGQDVVLEAPVNLPEDSGQATQFVPAQWALRKVGYLLDHLRLNGMNAELKDEVVRLGTQYRIATPYTSFLALEPGSQPAVLPHAELTDHFETINQDRRASSNAFGNPDARLFSMDDRVAGAGDESLEDVIGLGSSNAPGTGGGWGGGNGLGIAAGAGRSGFGQRNGGGRHLLVMRHGGSRATEGAVDLALSWLAAQQDASGWWAAQPGGDAQATTALALLSFLGAGHSQKGGAYKETVNRAVNWLAQRQADSGRIGLPNEDADAVTAAHLFAGWALSEAAGMGRVPETIRAAQRCVDFACGKNAGGRVRLAAACDGQMELLGWAVLFLKSARLAGVLVAGDAWDGINASLDALEWRGAGYPALERHRYRARKDDLAATPRATATGCLIRMHLGAKLEDLQGGLGAVLKEGGLPRWDAVKSAGDVLHWYAATACAFQAGCEMWKTWNEALKAALAPQQRKDGDAAGSWDPPSVGGAPGDRAWMTALCALCLETYYRYLPIYKDDPAPAAPPQPRPIALPNSDSGKAAVDYSEYLRQLQEGKQ